MAGNKPAAAAPAPAAAPRNESSNAAPREIETRVARTPRGTHNPSSRGISEDEAASSIADLMGTGDGKPRKPARDGKPQNRTERAERLAAESLRAGDTDDVEGDEGREGEDPEDDDRAPQRDDDAPADTDENEDDDRDDDLGVDPDGEDDDDESDIADRRVAIKANGKTEKVTIAELKKGYQRHRDYSQKTAQVAHLRQVVEQEGHTVFQQRQALDGLLVHHAAIVSQAYGQEPDWDRLYQENPLEFVKRRADFDQRNRQLTQLEQIRAQNAQVASHQWSQQNAQRMQAEAQTLFEKKPEWRDPVKGKAARERLLKYAGTYGYKPEDLSITDSRHLLILDKAERYDALMERARRRTLDESDDPAPRRRADPDPPRPRAPRPATPGAAQSTRPPNRREKELTQAKSRLAKTGRAEDAGAAIALLLP